MSVKNRIIAATLSMIFCLNLLPFNRAMVWAEEIPPKTPLSTIETDTTPSNESITQQGEQNEINSIPELQAENNEPDVDIQNANSNSDGQSGNHADESAVNSDSSDESENSKNAEQQNATDSVENTDAENQPANADKGTQSETVNGSEVITVDTTALTDAINAAGAIDNSEGVYTEESYTALQEILKLAIARLDGGDLTDNDVTLWIYVINNFVEKLVLSGTEGEINLASLLAVIQSAITTQSTGKAYTGESLSLLDECLTDAINALKTGIQTQVEADTYVLRILNAVYNLELPNSNIYNTDMAELENAINAAELMDNADGAYTQESFSVLMETVRQARHAMERYSLTQEEADAWAERVWIAKVSLQQVDAEQNSGPDTSVLIEALTRAAEVLNAGAYEADQYTGLMTTIINAQIAADLGFNTQEEVNSWVTALDDAIIEIHRKNDGESSEVSTEELEAVISEAISLGDMDKDYTEESRNQLRELIAEASAELEIGLQNQEDSDNWIRKINDAINALVPIEKAAEPVNTESLEQLLDKAQWISNDNGAFTAESYASLQENATEVRRALDLGFLSEDELDFWTKKLESAIDGLKLVEEQKDPEFATLKDTISEAENITNTDKTYTDESYSRLLSAIRKAKLCLKSKPEQSEADAAEADLQYAMQTLEKNEKDDGDTPTDDLFSLNGSSKTGQTSPVVIPLYNPYDSATSSLFYVSRDIRDQVELPTNLYEIAAAELGAEDSFEFPFQTDTVKYNEWLYEEPVCNPIIDGEYVQFYSWNTTFVSWCTDQLAYIDFGRSIRTADSVELFRFLTDNPNNDIITLSEALSVLNPVEILPGDLLFIPSGTNGYIIGIVAEMDPYARTANCIFGDVECSVEMMQVDLTTLSSKSRFIRIYVQDPELTAIASFLIHELGITPTAACGVLSNMNSESGFDSYALGDSGTSFGLCQWHNERWDRLIDFCDREGYRWQSYIGQLNYLVYELENHYPDVLNILVANSNDRESAYICGYYFCRDFEMPKEAETKGDARGMSAKNLFYNKLFSSKQIDEERLVGNTSTKRSAIVTSQTAEAIPDDYFTLY